MANEISSMKKSAKVEILNMKFYIIACLQRTANIWTLRHKAAKSIS